MAIIIFSIKLTPCEITQIVKLPTAKNGPKIEVEYVQRFFLHVITPYRLNRQTYGHEFWHGSRVVGYLGQVRRSRS